MDRMIYTAMSGAKHILEQQATTANNLANINSTGFKAQIDAFRAIPVVSPGLNTRAFVVDATVGTDFNPGPIQQTNRDMDVAVQGKGWIAVQRADGTEAYTRNGSLQLDQNGVLQTNTGLNVVGTNGPIAVPADVTISIGKDGTISSVQNTLAPGPSNIIGQLKLVNPNESNLVRATDGLFVTADGSQVDPDPNVQVLSGALEGSNVNAVDAMVNMISTQSQFNVQMQLLKNSENNEQKASQIFNLT